MCGNESLQQQTRAMRLLGLAKRAGAVSSGVEGVRSLCRSGRAGVVLVAKDCSPNSQKRIADCCAFYRVRLVALPCGKQEPGHAIGKSEAAAAAVGNAGLAREILSCFAAQESKERGGN